MENGFSGKGKSTSSRDDCGICINMNEWRLFEKVSGQAFLRRSPKPLERIRKCSKCTVEKITI